MQVQKPLLEEKNIDIDQHTTVPASLRCPLHFYDVNQDTKDNIQNNKKALLKAWKGLTKTKQMDKKENSER